MTRGRPNRFHLAYSADKGGALRNQVYVGGHFQLDDDEAFVDRRERRRRRVLHGADLQRLGHDDGDRGPHRQPQQGAVRAQRRRHVDLRASSNTDPGVHNWVDPCGLTEGILTLRMAEFPGQRPTEDLAASGRW